MEHEEQRAARARACSEQGNVAELAGFEIQLPLELASHLLDDCEPARPLFGHVDRCHVNPSCRAKALRVAVLAGFEMQAQSRVALKRPGDGALQYSELDLGQQLD